MLLFIGAAILVSVGSVLIAGDITDAAEWRRSAPLLAGLAFTGGFWFTADKSGLLRYRAMAVASMATGLVLWAVGEGRNYDPVGYYLLAMGGFMLVAGAAALIRFLRRNPVLDDDEHP